MYYCENFKKIAIKHYQTNTAKDIIKLFEISNGTLFNWIHRQSNNYEPAKRGRPIKIQGHIKAYIRSYVLRKVVFSHRVLIKNIKNKYKIDISKTSIYNILKKMDIVNKIIYYYRDRQRIKNYLQRLRDFKEKINSVDHNKIICLDETAIYMGSFSKRGWGCRRKRLTMKEKAEKKYRYTCIVSITNKKVLHSQTFMGSGNKEIFLEYLKDVLAIYHKESYSNWYREYYHKFNHVPSIEEINYFKQNDKCYVLMDNCAFHTANIIKEYIKNINDEIIFNVPYSPQYNPIEMIFSPTKYRFKQCTNNNSDKNIKNNIKKSLRYISAEMLTNCYKKSFSFPDIRD